MICVSVLYPAGPDASFDMDYYCQRHIPLVRDRVGAALKGVSVEGGMAGGTPGSAPTYVAIGRLLFDSVESFQAAFAPHGPEIMADVPKYTNVQPTLQISEVLI